MRPVTITVPGSPVGKGRPKFARRGKFTVAYTPEKTASYENLVKLAAHEAMQGRQIMDGPIHVELSIMVPIPASWSKKKQAEALAGTIRPTTKPDADNVIKGIFDAFNDIVWLDDKQVVSGTFSKHYSQTPLVNIRVALAGVAE